MNKKKTLFIVARKNENSGDFTITKDLNFDHHQALLQAILDHKVEHQFCMPIVTDNFAYKGNDQVIPLQPEQLFFMDYVDPTTIEGKTFLEVGLGSGVLSIFCLRKGAKKGTGLDINPRAKIFTGFNAMVNEVSDQLEIRDGNTTDLFAAVSGETFDFIFSNPPFEPTPPGMDYYMNSAAGIYGLSFVEALLENVDKQLAEGGTFQMVTMAPGDEKDPFLLYRALEKYLPSMAVEIILDHQPILYNDFVDRFVEIFDEEHDAITNMKQTAQKDKVSHCHMLVLKYKKGEKGDVTIRRSRKLYESWSSPLGAEVSISALGI